MRRLTFDDLWVTGGENAAAPGVVPLELIEDGDRQAGVFFAQPTGPGRHTWGPPASLDALAERPAVESVVTAGPVVARVPLPHVRELAAGMTDAETLRNLPNLEWLSVHRGVERGPLDAGSIPSSVRWLACAAETFGSPEAVVARLPALERLSMHGLWDGGSAEPLAALTGLRWLQVDPAKGLQHLGKLEALERLELDVSEGAKLSGLTPLRKLGRLRSMRLVGSGVRGLDGIGDLTALEVLDLERVDVDDLSPLAGHPSVASVRLEHLRRLTDLSPLETLPALRRLEVRLGAHAVTVPAGFAARDVEIVLDGEPRAGTAVGPVSYRRLDDGTWSIFADAAVALGVETNFEAEERVRGAIRDEDGALHDRLTFDSESGGLAITADSEEDIRRAAELVAAMAPSTG